MIKFLASLLPLFWGMIFFLNSSILLGQNTPKYYVPDSLKKYSYKELYKKQNTYYSDTIKYQIYVNAYLNKAKNEKDTVRIAHGYSQKAAKVVDIITIKYLDSIIRLTETNQSKDYPAYGYLWKGTILYNKGKYKSALNNLLMAHKAATKNQNFRQLLTIKNHIGMIKLVFGDIMGAKKYFKSIINNTNYSDLDIYELFYNRERAAHYLTYTYAATGKFDSAYIFANKKKNLLLSRYDSILSMMSYKESISEIEFFKENYNNTLDLLSEVKEYIDVENEFNFNYLYGSSLAKLNKKDSAFAYFKKADSIYLATNDLMPETRNVQEFFIDYYKEKGNLEKQLYHINRLLKIDSLYNDLNIHLNSSILKNYETPQLLAEKQTVINALSYENKRSFRIIFSLALLSIILILTGGWYYNRQKKQKQKLKKLLAAKPIASKPSKEPKKLEGISIETIKSITTQLESFTNELLFLDSTITLNSLAKKFGTNATYLSKVINHTQNKNFSSYLTDLRIDHCVEKLKSNKEYRKFTIQAIANECGFNSAETFSKAFYKKTGLYPSYFIKEIQNQDK